jgi:hypothetical protein
MFLWVPFTMFVGGLFAGFTLLAVSRKSAAA